jgi:hypothetical protein
LEGWGDVDWIGLAEDRDKWRRAHVNTAMNLRNKMLGSSERCITGCLARRAHAAVVSLSSWWQQLSRVGTVIALSTHAQERSKESEWEVGLEHVKFGTYVRAGQLRTYTS